MIARNEQGCSLSRLSRTTMDESEEELLEFLRNLDEEGRAELIAAMEASPTASKLVRECRWCDYVAGGNGINEVILDLGAHVRRRHPEQQQRLERAKDLGMNERVEDVP
jgi:hypothetical protein